MRKSPLDIRSTLLLFAAVLALSSASCDRLANLLSDDRPSTRADREETHDEDGDQTPRKPRSTKPGRRPSPNGTTEPPAATGPSTASTARPSPPKSPWDLTWLPAKLRGPDGKPIRLTKLNVYGRESLGMVTKARVHVEIQSAENPSDFDVLIFTEGELSDRKPVKFSLDPPTPEVAARMTWDERDLDFGAIARMVEDAPTRSGASDGTVSHVSCNRPIPFSCDLRCRVFVSSERRDAFAEYDAKGAPWKDRFPWTSNLNPCRDLRP